MKKAEHYQSKFKSIRSHLFLRLTLFMVVITFSMGAKVEAQTVPEIVFGEGNRYAFLNKIPCETVTGTGRAHYYLLVHYWQRQLEGERNLVYGVADALTIESEYDDKIPYSNDIPPSPVRALLYVREGNDTTYSLVRSKLVHYVPQHADSSYDVVHMKYPDVSGDTLKVNMLEIYFDEPYDVGNKKFFVLLYISDYSQYPEYNYQNRHDLARIVRGCVWGRTMGWDLSGYTNDSCLVPGRRMVPAAGTNFAFDQPPLMITTMYYPYDIAAAGHIGMTNDVWFLSPIMQPDTHVVPDTVPPCMTTYPFNITYNAHDTVILDWTHFGDGDFQASLDHSGSDFLSGTLIDFTDSLDKLVITGLEQGDHTLCFRRHCYHECDYHGQMDYYSNWGNCLFFYADGAEVGVMQAEEPHVQMQPNPAHSEVRIEADEFILAVELCDLAGRTLLQKSLPEDATYWNLNLDALPKGTYMVRVITERGATTKKLVLQ